jgi:brefeldin A-inhibited guanine nucleotide-exchange protein
MMRTQRKGSKGGDQFFSASHFVHVRPMFEVAWIPFLAGLSGPLQDTDDLEVVELCLDGFKSAIRIVCFFDLELERNAFVTTLTKFTFLNNLGEMKTKNMEAIKTLLDVAVTEGNHLKGSWHEVLTCVSQLEHMQLISGGTEADSRQKGWVSSYIFPCAHVDLPTGGRGRYRPRNWLTRADQHTSPSPLTWCSL